MMTTQSPKGITATQAVLVIIVSELQKVILRFRNVQPEMMKWECPQTTLKKNESLSDAVLRLMKENFDRDITPDELDDSGSYFVSIVEGVLCDIHIFVVRTSEEDIPQSAEFTWETLCELSKRKLTDVSQKAIHSIEWILVPLVVPRQS